MESEARDGLLKRRSSRVSNCPNPFRTMQPPQFSTGFDPIKQPSRLGSPAPRRRISDFRDSDERSNGRPYHDLIRANGQAGSHSEQIVPQTGMDVELLTLLQPSANRIDFHTTRAIGAAGLAPSENKSIQNLILSHDDGDSRGGQAQDTR